MHDIIYIISTIIIVLVVIIINITLFYILSLLLINLDTSHTPSILTLKAYPNTLSKNSLKKMLSQRNEHITIGKKVENNLFNLHILINATDLTTLEKKSQTCYKSSDYRKLLHSIKHTHIQYLSQLLDIPPNTEQVNKHTHKINLATSLSATFSIFCTVMSKKFVPPTTNIIHEIVGHLHKTGYEVLGYSTLMNILKDSKKYTITITSKKIEFLLTNTCNKLGVNIFTNISIYKRTNPSINYNISTIYSFYILQQDLTYNSDISYTNMYFTLSFPQTMKRYINIEGHDIVQNSTEFSQKTYDYTILIFNGQNNHNQYIIQYKMPDPITIQPVTALVLTYTEDKKSIKKNISTITKIIHPKQQRKTLHLQVETDGISHFILNQSHKKK